MRLQFDCDNCVLVIAKPEDLAIVIPLDMGADQVQVGLDQLDQPIAYVVVRCR